MVTAPCRGGRRRLWRRPRDCPVTANVRHAHGRQL